MNHLFIYYMSTTDQNYLQLLIALLSPPPTPFFFSLCLSRRGGLSCTQPVHMAQNHKTQVKVRTDCGLSFTQNNNRGGGEGGGGCLLTDW